ncbi:hypothetical protein, partial [Actinopolymorpha pittospori]|uniref:hypothetical protein n=1 Tax=Actinopolymorpha pittospori TaxID=648752 RepID=UPI0031ECFBB7
MFDPFSPGVTNELAGCTRYLFLTAFLTAFFAIFAGVFFAGAFFVVFLVTFLASFFTPAARLVAGGSGVVPWKRSSGTVGGGIGTP